jgi:DNA repair exonuclease SbcCD ATPase subunit
MQITRLALRNFRSYQAADLDLAPGLNIVGGLNAAGKSTLLDAISVGLTGTARGAESGRSLEDLRRYGDRKKWEVQIHAGDELFTRQEGEGPRAAVQDRIEAHLHVPGSVIRACLYSGELLRLDRKAAQRLVLDLTKPAAIELPSEVVELIAGAIPQEHTNVIATLSEIDALYRRVYEARTANGRALKALGEPEPPVAPDGMAGMDGPTLESHRRTITRKLEALEGEREQAIRAQAEAEAAPRRERERLKRIDRDLAKWREKRKQLPPQGDVKMRALSLSHQITAAEEGKTSAATAHRDAVQRQAKAEALLARAGEDVTAAEAAPETCPTCGAKATAASRKKAIESARDRLKAAEAEAAAARNQLAEAKSILQATPDVEALKRQLVALEEGEAAAATIEAAITELEREREMRPAEPQPAAVADPAALAERIAEGRRRLELLSSYLAAAEQHAKYEHARDRLDAERDDLDRLCELLGPDGIRKDLAGGGGVQLFQSVVNEQLRPMGYQADFAPLLALEDDAIVNGLPTRLLSSSEQIRFGLAFQVAVASASGFGLIVVDDFDRLDPGSRAAALSVLSDCGHQVLVLSTILGKTVEEFQAMARERNAVPGPRYFYVSREGGASRVEAPGIAGAGREAA